MDGFSIIVCCYNSASRINKTLFSLSQLVCPSGFKVEIVLVNNCSSDDTVLISTESWNSFNSLYDFKIVTENSLGLSNARICGILNSKYKYLIFCDDDNHLFPNYLLEVDKSFSNLDCLIVGGLGIPLSDNDLPDWFNDFGQSAYAVGRYGRTEGFGNLCYGAGLSIRRNIAQKYIALKKNLFLSDRKGKNLSSGGDTELCLIVGLNHVYYNPNLKFYHYLGKRVNEKHFIKLNNSFGKDEAYILYYRLISLSFFSSLSFVFNVLVVSVKKLILLYLVKNKNFFQKVKIIYYKSFIKSVIFSLFKFNFNRKKAIFNINYLNK